jgi:hypothetical protein
MKSRSDKFTCEVNLTINGISYKISLQKYISEKIVAILQFILINGIKLWLQHWYFIKTLLLKLKDIISLSEKMYNWPV